MTRIGRRAVVISVIAAILLAAIGIEFLRPARDDLALVRHAGVLRVGVSDDYPPFASAEGGARRGLDVELAQRLARDLGVKVQWVHFSWPQLSGDLSAGRFDLALSGITMRPERALAGHFSRPYATTGAVALIRSSDASRYGDPSALDRAGVRIAVNAGGHLERVARQKFPRASIVALHDNRALAEAVLGAAADAAVSDDAEARALARPELTALGPFTRDRKAVWLRAGAFELSGWVEGWLTARERDGWLPELRHRYLGAAVGASAMDAEAVMAAIQLRSELMPDVAAVKAHLGMPIEDPAQEARVLSRAADAARRHELDPESVRGVYRELMSAAREIERARSAPTTSPLPTLDALRSAIGGVDTELIAALRAALDSDPHREWAALVHTGLSVDGLSENGRDALIRALNRVERSR